MNEPCLPYRCREGGICAQHMLGTLSRPTLRAWLRPHRAALAEAGLTADWRRFPADVPVEQIARTLRAACLQPASGASPGRRSLVASIRVLDALLARRLRGPVLHNLLSLQRVDAQVPHAEAAVRLWLADSGIAGTLARRLHSQALRQ
jgi:hypothetical protein